jgi:hypothetical protein
LNQTSNFHFREGLKLWFEIQNFGLKLGQPTIFLPSTLATTAGPLSLFCPTKAKIGGTSSSKAC